MSDTNNKQAAKAGDTVVVNYKGSFDDSDGEVFDSSFDNTPIQFKIGEKMMIPGFENLVIGMTLGETKEKTLLPQEAYGPHREDYVMKMDKAKFPDDFEFDIGGIVQGSTPDGTPITAKIIEESGPEVILDFNHPLSGRNLNFKVELLEILTGDENESP